MRPRSEFIPAAAGRGWTFQMRTAEAFPFGWHAHDGYELTAVTRGSGCCFVGDAAVPYAPGHVAVFGSRLPHTYSSSPADGPQSAYVAHFRPELVSRLLAEAEFRSVRVLLHRASRGAAVTTASPSTRRALARLATSSGARQTLALFDVLVDLAQSADLRTLSSDTTAEAPSETLARVIDYVERHYQHTISREEISAAVALSPSSVSRLVRRELGTTVTGYLTHVRLGAACRALVDTDQPIAHIAYACGFASLANFNRHFRHSRGMTPREYRQAFRSLPAENAALV